MNKSIHMCCYTEKKKRNCLDIVVVCEKHSEPVNAKTPTTSRWQSIFQCCAEILINEHCLVITGCFVLSVHKYNLSYQLLAFSSRETRALDNCQSGIRNGTCRGGFKEWPLRQWLTRPSRNEKRSPFGWTRFYWSYFLLLKELLSIGHFISHEFDISSFSASNTTLSTL